MSELNYKTAGESHGDALLIIVEGIPAGLRVDEEYINLQLSRRQRGPGRSRRQEIENDAVEILGGWKGGLTIGAPVAMLIRNRDAKIEMLPNPAVPRPGHADLAGVYKFASLDIRAVLERASARETAARTAAGSLAALLLKEFNINVFGYVTEIGGITARDHYDQPDAADVREASPFRSLDRAVESEWDSLIQNAAAEGDTLGGIVKIVATGVPPGLGHYNSGANRLDGRLAGALASIPAVKGVEFGVGFDAARRRGSETHDEIVPAAAGAGFAGLDRLSNHAGGLEGGMTNGQPLIVRIAMKPIPTMKRGAASVNLATGEPETATYQRSDVCAVPALSVVAEAVVAFELARALLDKFGGDTLEETKRAFEGWRNSLKVLLEER